VVSSDIGHVVCTFVVGVARWLLGTEASRTPHSGYPSSVA
jgi:hypothetical protein